MATRNMTTVRSLKTQRRREHRVILISCPPRSLRLCVLAFYSNLLNSEWLTNVFTGGPA